MILADWQEFLEDSKARWEENAEFWDDYMGADDNRFHREIVRPATERLLCVEKGQRILDVACGNGNFSRRLADLGARVVAFDFSAKMIARAKARSESYHGRIKYSLLDATCHDALLSLGAFFEAGFAVDGIEEPTFDNQETALRFEWIQIPPALIVRVRGQSRADTGA